MEISKKNIHKTFDSSSVDPISKTLEIFVGGLPSHTTSHLLKKYFSQYGSLKKSQPQKWKSGAKKCRGFAIIQCEDLTTYKRILANGHEFEGRIIECKPCLGKKDLAIYNKNLADRKVFINNVPKFAKSEDLKDIFSEVGEVEMAYVVQKSNGRGNKGIGFVTFTNKRDSEKAIKIGKFKFKGTEIVCARYESKNFEEKKKANPGFFNNTKNNKKFHEECKSPSKKHKKLVKFEREEEFIKKATVPKHNQGGRAPLLETEENSDKKDEEERKERDERRREIIKNRKKSVGGSDGDCNPENFFKFLTPFNKEWHRLFRSRRIDNSFGGGNYRMNYPQSCWLQ